MRPSNKGDHELKGWFGKYLISQGHYNIQTTTKFCPYDLSSEKDGILYYWELKVRHRKALDGKYNDTCCEDIKVKDSPNPARSFLVSFFDDYWTVTPYKELTDKQYVKAQISERNKRHIKKIFLSHPLKESELKDYE